MMSNILYHLPIKSDSYASKKNRDNRYPLSLEKTKRGAGESPATHLAVQGIVCYTALGWWRFRCLLECRSCLKRWLHVVFHRGGCVAA